MLNKDRMLLLGEHFYNLKTGKELYDRAIEYLEKFKENSEDLHSGQLYLDLSYAAFMEGYATSDLCHDIGSMVKRGFAISGHDLLESENISIAIMRYGAEQLGSGWCAHLLSYIFEDGPYGSVRDCNEWCWYWLEEAARLGDVDAQFSLGNELYRSKRKYEAEEWWIAAAEQGKVEAMHNLGILYEGSGFYDYIKAGHWYEQAAIHGDDDAQTHLVKNYRYDEKRKKWLKII